MNKVRQMRCVFGIARPDLLESCNRIIGPAANLWQNKDVQFPLSADEHAAMARYLSGIKRQLQEVSDLFTSRYGKGNEISEVAVKTLVSVTLLEHDFLMLEEPPGKIGPRITEFGARAN